MKIAVPVSKENHIEAHIGNCEYYNIFTISDNKEINDVARIKSPGGCGCNTDIASVLASGGVSTVLAAGIGGGSIKAFKRSGINVIGGCSGDSTEVVKLYLNGLIEDKGSSCHIHQHHHLSEVKLAPKTGHQCACGHDSSGQCSN